MEAQKRELLKVLIENNRVFELRQINYEIQKNGQGDYMAIVWSPKTEAFHGTSIIPVLEFYFSSFVVWNSDKQRCELHVF
jgi:hypothetical protein